MAETQRKPNLELKTDKRTPQIKPLDQRLFRFMEKRHDERGMLLLEYLQQQKDININERDGIGRTCLHVACEAVDLSDVIELLSCADIDINTYSKHKGTPLTSALKSHHADMESLLLLLLDNKGIDVHAKDETGTPAWSYFLKYEFRYGDENRKLILDKFICHPSMKINEGDDGGETLLMHIASNIHLADTMNKILAMPELDINKQDLSGYTLLHHLLHLIDTSYCGQILERCIAVTGRDDINLSVADKHGKTAFMAAVEKNCKPLVKAMLQKDSLNVNQVDCCGSTALFYCKDMDMLKTLLSVDNIDINIINRTGLSAFRNHLLNNSKHDNVKDILSEFQSHKGYDINKVHTEGLTDFMWAAKELTRISELTFDQSVLNHLVQEFVVHHPKCDVKIKNSEDKTVLHVAAIHNNGVIIKTILEHSSYDKSLLNSQDREKKTFLHYLCLGKSARNKEINFKVIEELVNAGNIDLNIQDSEGYIPLMYAVQTNFTPLLLFVLQDPNKCDLSKRNKYNQTLFDIANTTDLPLDARVKSLLEKHSDQYAVTFRSEISIPQQLKALKQSLSVCSDLSARRKDDLIVQVGSLESDLKIYTCGQFTESHNQMTQLHRDKIQGRRRYLLQNLSTIDVMDCLREKSIFTDQQAEEVTVEKTLHSRVDKFLSILKTRGPNAYPYFIDALNATDQQFIADELTGFDPYATVVEGSNESEGASGDFQIAIPEYQPQLQQLGQQLMDINATVAKMLCYKK